MKTTKSFTLLWLMMAALLAVGCNGKKAQQTEVADIEDPAVEDSTVYGVCGSNTAMSTLELIVGKGPKEFETKMQKTLTALSTDFESIRVGRANPDRKSTRLNSSHRL